MPDYKLVVVSTTDKKKNKKKKKENAALAIVKGLIPWKGDSVGEIIRKIVFLVSIVALCVAVLIIIDKKLCCCCSAFYIANNAVISKNIIGEIRI